jgi:hypothetical protein
VEGGLLRAARPIPDVGWTRGVLVNSSQCVDGLPYPYCEPTASASAKTSQESSEVSTFIPVGIYVKVDCTTLGYGDPLKYAEQGLDVTREYVVAQEFATGTTTSNPSLADATSVGSAADAVAALALLENEIADETQGRLAYIHVSPGNGVLLSEVLRYDAGRWYTPSGNLVVISPGYHDLTDLHATGEVYAETSSTATLDDVDRSFNTRFATAEESGLAVFDPCFNISVGTESSA